MAPEIIIDKDGNKMFLAPLLSDCKIHTVTDFGRIRYSVDADIISGSDFTRCDYNSFSK